MATQNVVGEFKKFIQFVKLEDKDGEAPTVWGVATWEVPDCDREICDFETAVPVYQAWSKAALKRTKGAGQALSLGPIRVQHGMTVGGKATKLEFKDDAKEIWLGSEPVNDDIRDQLKGGFLTGYSQGGSYAWRACEECESPMILQQGANFCDKCGKMVDVRYGLRRLAEVSYVDSPATGEGFEHVKSNGSTEILKFAKKSTEEPVKKEKVVRDDATKAAAKAKALAFVKTQIDLAAIAKGFQPNEFEKGLYTVSRFAEMLECMSGLYESAVWEREIEGDESSVPDELKELLDSMIGAFILMATEEARELSAKKNEQPGDAMTPEELELQKAAKKSLASHFAKAASHHEKMANIHSKMVDAVEDCMGKAATARTESVAKAKAEAEAKGEVFKEDVGSGASSGDVHTVLPLMQRFHKSSMAAHTKMGEHCDKMAESCDADSAKAVKAEIKAEDEAFAKANPEVEVTAPVVKESTMEDDIKKAAAEERNSPEYKARIAAIGKAQVDAEVAKLSETTLAPLGVTIDETTGAAILKGGVRVVQRDEKKEEFAFAGAGSVGNTGGL